MVASDMLHTWSTLVLV